MADRRGNLLRDVEPIGCQVDVVGDERHARADHGRAGAWVRRGRTEIGRPPHRRHLGGQPLELAAADILEVLAGRIRGGFLVEIDRDLEARRHLGSDFLRERHAVGHGHAFNRHERHHVDGAQPRMLAGVAAEVDIGDRTFEQRQYRSLDAGRVAGQREHGSVVRRIGGMIEQADTGDTADCGGHRRDDLGAPSLAHVGDAFDQHKGLDSSAVLPQITML